MNKQYQIPSSVASKLEQIKLCLLYTSFVSSLMWLSHIKGKQIFILCMMLPVLSLFAGDYLQQIIDSISNTETGPTPAQLVEQLAIGKCLAVAKQHPDAVVIGCDTVVDVGGAVFGKPHDAEDAKRMLRALSGKTHQVQMCIRDRSCPQRGYRGGTAPWR